MLVGAEAVRKTTPDLERNNLKRSKTTSEKRGGEGMKTMISEIVNTVCILWVEGVGPNNGRESKRTMTCEGVHQEKKREDPRDKN